MAEREKRGVEIMNPEEYKTEGYGDRTEESGTKRFIFCSELLC